MPVFAVAFNHEPRTEYERIHHPEAIDNLLFDKRDASALVLFIHETVDSRLTRHGEVKFLSLNSKFQHPAMRGGW